MDKMLVAVFESEKQAFAAAGAMNDLREDGILLVYASGVIVKDAGRISIVEFTNDSAGSDSVLGIATRSLIELLAKPVFSADEVNSQAIADQMMEITNAGVDAVFLDEVARHLSPGKAAIVAEIEEETVTAMDTLIESLGGMVFRCVRCELMFAQIAKELDALHNEIQILEQQMLQSRDGSRIRLQGRLALATTGLHATKERARHRATTIKREAEAKIVLLQERAAKAEAGMKSRFERLADEVRVDYLNRAAKLNLARQFAGDGIAV